MDNPIYINSYTHPFKLDHVTSVALPDTVLSHALEEAGIGRNLFSLPTLRVYVDDRLIPPEKINLFYLKPGQLVTVRLVPMGKEGGGKDVLRIVAMIAVLALVNSNVQL